jgi:large subunit ribosomal protein L9
MLWDRLLNFINTQGDLAMDLILLEKINRLGKIGDTVKVKDGFARNYLLPQGKALRATAENKARFEAQRADIEARNARMKVEAEQTAEKLKKIKVELVRAAGDDGKLYGSITVRDVGAALEAKGFNIPRQNLLLDVLIKTIGQYEVRVSLHPEVELRLPLRVGRNEAEFSMMDKKALAAAEAAAAAEATEATAADAAA